MHRMEESAAEVSEVDAKDTRTCKGPSMRECTEVEHDDLSVLTCFNNVVVTYHQAVQQR